MRLAKIFFLGCDVALGLPGPVSGIFSQCLPGGASSLDEAKKNFGIVIMEKGIITTGFKCMLKFVSLITCFLAIGDICEALALIYSPAASNDQRKLAQDFLETVKEDPSCPLYGHHLAHVKSRSAGPYSDIERFFGLQLLENAIRHKWASAYSDAERQQIKDLVIDLISGGLVVGDSADLTSGEKLFIKEKVALILAELAEREWPQRWHDLDSFLVQMAASGSRIHLHIAVVFLRHLAEDVFVFPNPVTTKRKEDLRNSLISILSQAPLDGQNSAVSVEIYQQCGIRPGNEGWIARLFSVLVNCSQTDEYTTVTCVETLGSFVEWIPYDVLSKASLAQNLFLLLDNKFSAVQKAACESLVLLSGRMFSDWKQANDVILKPFLSNEALAVLNNAWMKNNGAGNVEEDDRERHISEEYPLLKRIAQFWCDVGIHHICHKKAESAPDNLDNYIQVLIQLTKHQSLTISSIAVHTWLALARAEVIAKSPCLTSSYQHIFEILVMKLNKYPVLIVGEDEEDDAPLSARYSNADYEVIQEFHTAFGSFRSQAANMMKLIVTKSPLSCIQTVSALVLNVISQPEPKYGQAKIVKNDWNANHLLTVTSRYYCLWDTAVTAIHFTFPVISPAMRNVNSDAYLQIRQASMQMFETLLNYSAAADPLIISRQLDGLSSFTHFFDADSRQLAFMLLQKMFSFVTFTLPNERKTVDDAWDVSEDTKALRRKACSSLLRIVPALGEILHSIYNEIVGEISRLIRDQLISLPEEANLEEFQAAIIFHSTLSGEAKFNAYQTIFEHHAMSLVSAEVASINSTLDSFTSAIGTSFLLDYLKKHPDMDLKNASIGVPELKESIYNFRRTRRLLYYCVHAYKCCLSRTVRLGSNSNESLKAVAIKSSPWAVNLCNVIVPLLSFVKNIHGLCNPELWKDAPLPLQQLTQLTSLEKAVISGQSTLTAPELEELNVLNGTLAGEIIAIQNWMRTFRESLYGLLGQSTHLVPGDEFYGIPGIADMVLSQLFQSASILSNYQWRQLICFFARPFILNCPATKFHDVLLPVLPSLFTFLWRKLDKEWASMIQSGAFVDLSSPENDAEVMRGQGGSQDVQPDQSEEILTQKILTDFSRVYGDLISAMFLSASPEAVKASKATPLSPDFGMHMNLIKFCLDNSAIAEPLLFSMISSLCWKDTKVCTFSTRALSKIVPAMSSNPLYHTFVAKDCMLGALRALHDGYHQEGHDALINLATEIYTLCRPKSQIVLETLSAAVPDFPAKEFDSKIMKETKAHAQRKIMKEALTGIIGVKPGQWHNKPLGSTASVLRLLPEKMILQTANNQSQPSDFEESLDGKHGAGLLELFGN